MFDALKFVARAKQLGDPNPALDKVIEIVKSAYPHRFLQPHELKLRKFVHEPACVIPFESCIYPLDYKVPIVAKRSVKKRTTK